MTRRLSRIALALIYAIVLPPARQAAALSRSATDVVFSQRLSFGSVTTKQLPSSKDFKLLPLALGISVNTLTQVNPADMLAEKLFAIEPALESLAHHETGGIVASVAGQTIEKVLTGEKSADNSDVLAAIPDVPASTLAPYAPEIRERPAAAPPAPKTVESFASYQIHRWGLKVIAALTGAVFSMPQAGAALTAKIIASAADKKLVISDFDDTLADWNAVLPAEKVAVIRAIRAAGKQFAIVSNRLDEKLENSTQLTIFESLASLPADVTEGIYVAANSGGRIYQFRGGVPVKIHEATSLQRDELKRVEAAAASTLARLKKIGIEQHPGDLLNPKESFSAYGYALLLRVRTDAEKINRAVDIMRKEFTKQRLKGEVSGATPQNAASDPPYLSFTTITKSESAALIAKFLGIAAKDAVVIGDMMYASRAAKKESWLTRLGLRLSGLAIGVTGNGTDINMARGLPGALALGVGRMMDPRIPNGWNLAGYGPEITQKILESVADGGARRRRLP